MTRRRTSFVAENRAGRPLIVLVMVLAGWTVMRVAAHGLSGPDAGEALARIGPEQTVEQPQEQALAVATTNAAFASAPGVGTAIGAGAIGDGPIGGGPIGSAAAQPVSHHAGVPLRTGPARGLSSESDAGLASGASASTSALRSEDMAAANVRVRLPETSREEFRRVHLAPAAVPEPSGRSHGAALSGAAPAWNLDTPRVEAPLPSLRREELAERVPDENADYGLERNLASGSFTSQAQVSGAQVSGAGASTPSQAQDNSPSERRARTAASHNLLYMAAMAHVPLPGHVLDAMEGSGLVNAATSVTEPPLAPQQQLSFGDRLSVDSWLFLRQGDADFALTGPNAASYGRSQAGAVMRYQLAPSSGFEPSAYVRATGALGSVSEQDLAAGLSVKPVASLPLSLHGEARLSRFADGSTEVRPAAFITAGMERSDLPLGLAARGYGQAGYVGGKFATPFADGMLVVDRQVARFDLGNLRAGAGVWGGAQKGARRLDLGPSANISVRIGEVPARVSFDYRFRVAGDAQPGSGAALTVSTGF